MRSATAIVLEQSPHLTYYSAGETARRMLRDIETKPEFAQEKAKIADLEELDEIATGFVRSENKPDQTRLKALELSYRRKGALIDKSQVEQTVKPAIPKSLQDADTSELIAVLGERLKLSSQGIKAESVEVTKVSDNV